MWVYHIIIVRFESSHKPRSLASPAEETSTDQTLIELTETLTSCWCVPMSKNSGFHC